jgi:hypothetical protein
MTRLLLSVGTALLLERCGQDHVGGCDEDAL